MHNRSPLTGGSGCVCCSSPSRSCWPAQGTSRAWRRRGPGSAPTDSSPWTPEGPRIADMQPVTGYSALHYALLLGTVRQPQFWAAHIWADSTLEAGGVNTSPLLVWRLTQDVFIKLQLVNHWSNLKMLIQHSSSDYTYFSHVHRSEWCGFDT